MGLASHNRKISYYDEHIIMLTVLYHFSGSDSQLVIVSERSNPPQSLKPSTVVSQEWLVESLLVGNVVSTEPFKRS